MTSRFALPLKGINIVCFLMILGIRGSSQITNGNWLFGGNINFSISHFSSALGTQTTYDFRVAGRAGHFVIDKLALGLVPNLLLNKVQGASRVKTTDVFFGGFARYYILPTEQRVNVFTEGEFSLGFLKGGGSDHYAQRYSVAAGPVIFLNSSVGLELSVAYSHTNFNNSGNTKTGLFQTGIGLQFYLERDIN